MSAFEHLPALLIVIPLLGAILCAFLSSYRLAWPIAFAVSLVLPIMAGIMLHDVIKTGRIDYAMGGWAPPFGIGYRVDVLSGFVLMIVSAMAPLVALYARHSLARETDPAQGARLYSLWLLCLAGLLGITITDDAFNAFVFLEISALSTYALVASGKDRRGLLAAYRYLMVGTIGATFYVIGVGLIYAMTGTLNFTDMAVRIGAVEDTRPALAALAFITAGLGIKAAIFPLHGWLPNAYAYAPWAIAAFIAATATKVAIYLLIRIYYSVYGADFVFGRLDISFVLIGLSVIGIFAASMVAIWQEDIKRMLAWSSVAQAGYMVLGMALANQAGLTGGVVHFFNHAITKGALFFALGMIALRVGATKLDDIAGVGHKMPVTTAAFTVASFSLTGVPGTAGFISKWYLGLGALEADMAWLLFLIALSSLISFVYVGRVLEAAYMRPPSKAVQGVTAPPLMMMIPTLMLAFLCVWFGFDTEYSAGVASRAAEILLGNAR